MKVWGEGRGARARAVVESLSGCKGVLEGGWGRRSLGRVGSELVRSVVCGKDCGDKKIAKIYHFVASILLTNVYILLFLRLLREII